MDLTFNFRSHFEVCENGKNTLQTLRPRNSEIFELYKKTLAKE
jgi:hypothetical protein